MDLWLLLVVAAVGWGVFQWGRYFGREECAKLLERLQKHGHPTAERLARVIQDGRLLSEKGFYESLPLEEQLLYRIERNVYPKKIDNLLRTPVNLTYRNTQGITPLIMSVRFQPGFNHQNVAWRVGTLKRIAASISKEGIDAQDNRGYTALMYAAEQADDHSIAILLNHGASTQLRNKDGLTAIDLASRWPSTRALLESREGMDRLLAISEKWNLA